MEKINISIIVPVYNAGQHFKRCMDTLIGQSMLEMEFILVLDCPTDGTEKMAEYYASIDKRVKLIYNTTNLHIGLSRNEGLKCAKGEYIGFSDHDDFRELTMYEKMYDVAVKENSDVVLSGRKTLLGDTEIDMLYPIKDDFDDIDFLGMHIGRDNENNEWFPFIRNGSLWNKIFKREMIFQNSIFFQDNRQTTFEDLSFLIEVFFRAHRVSIVNESFYTHVEEIMNTSSGYDYYSYRLSINHLTWLYNFLNDKRIYKQYKTRFDNAVVEVIFNSIKNEFRSSKKLIDKLMTLFQVRNNELVKIAFRDVDSFPGSNNRYSKLTKRIVKSFILV